MFKYFCQVKDMQLSIHNWGIVYLKQRFRRGQSRLAENYNFKGQEVNEKYLVLIKFYALLDNFAIEVQTYKKNKQERGSISRPPPPLIWFARVGHSHSLYTRPYLLVHLFLPPTVLLYWADFFYSIFISHKTLPSSY